MVKTKVLLPLVLVVSLWASIVEAQVVLYKSSNFTGQKLEITTNWSAGSNLKWNDSINSIKVPAGWKILIYENGPKTGRELELTKDWVADKTWKNKISNITIVTNPQKKEAKEAPTKEAKDTPTKDTKNPSDSSLVICNPKIDKGCDKAQWSVLASYPDDEFRDGILEMHNKYRKAHGVPPLKWSDEVAKVAHDWAIKMAENNNMSHNPNRRGYGENVFWASGGVTPTRPFWSWYAEFGAVGCQKNIPNGCGGHFTQVIWKNSTELGCARSRSRKSGGYAVCNYNPPGNYGGAYAANVPLPPCATEAHKIWLSTLSECEKMKVPEKDTCVKEAYAKWKEPSNCVHKVAEGK